MRRSILWGTVGIVLVGAGVFVYLFFIAGGSGEPSTDLTTPELTGTTEIPDAPGDTAASSTSSPVPATTNFVIDQTQSTARFEIDEVLQGQPQHVVGTTDQVAGQAQVDPNDLSSTVFSEIDINARTLSTGSERRDRAMRGPVILDSGSDANELITLAVTGTDGLEGSMAVGDSIEFTLSGDLTIKGTTQSVTFDVTVTFVDESTMRGSATAEVTREMFGIGIPSVPGVADVTEEVLIGLEFVALAP
jgi:polyisoprenoid-binding protein YceI